MNQKSGVDDLEKVLSAYIAFIDRTERTVFLSG